MSYDSVWSRESDIRNSCALLLRIMLQVYLHLSNGVTESVWPLVATYLNRLKNISCPKLIRSDWIWSQSVTWINQGVPSPFLSWKKRDAIKIMDPFPGLALFIPPEERARIRDQYLRNTLILNVINIAFLCERNWAENDLLSSSPIWLHFYLFVRQR